MLADRGEHLRCHPLAETFGFGFATVKDDIIQSVFIDNAGKAMTSQEEINIALGQGYYWRAFAYFNLVRVFGNDENKLKLIIINELPTSDKAAYSYMQPEYVEIKSVIDDINKMIVGVHVYYMDGSEDSDYYRVESISKSDISRIQIYRL